MDDNIVPIEIRCPFKSLEKKSGRLVTCNKLCVKVYPGSAGNVFCYNCKVNFDFEVASNSRESKRIIAVKK